jgi:hypothetical protein
MLELLELYRTSNSSKETGDLMLELRIWCWGEGSDVGSSTLGVSAVTLVLKRGFDVGDVPFRTTTVQMPN